MGIPFLGTQDRSSYGRNTIQGKQNIQFPKLAIPLVCKVIANKSFILTEFSFT
jgi:hypothetical protein